MLKATSANLKSGQNLGSQLLKSKGAREEAQQIFAQLLAEGVRLLNRSADINERNQPEKRILEKKSERQRRMSRRKSGYGSPNTS